MPSTLPATAPISRRRRQRPHPQLKDDHRAGRRGARARTHPSCQAKGMKEITDPAKKGHKKKTKHNQVHKKPTPAGRENPPAWA